MSGSEAESGIYEVERIEKKKITAAGKVMYYIKWKDYSEDDNTW